jgi:hypothetical protein
MSEVYEHEFLSRSKPVEESVKSLKFGSRKNSIIEEDPFQFVDPEIKTERGKSLKEENTEDLKFSTTIPKTDEIDGNLTKVLTELDISI